MKEEKQEDIMTNENGITSGGVPPVRQDLDEQSNNPSIEIIDDVRDEANDTTPSIEVIDDVNPQQVNEEADLTSIYPHDDNLNPSNEEQIASGSNEVVNGLNMQQSVQEDNMNTTEPVELEPAKVNKHHVNLKVIIPICLIIVIILVILLYKFVVLSNKRIFSSGVNIAYSGLSKAVNKGDDINLLNGDNELDATLTFNTSDTALKEFNGYKYNVNTKLDVTNKRVSGSFDISNDSSSLINLEVDYQNEKQYLKLAGIYNKIIKIGDSDDEINEILNNAQDVNYDKLNTSVKSIKDIVNKNIADDNLVNGEESISINNNEYKLKYVSLKLTKDEYSDLISNIINDIKSDNNLISNLKDSFGVTESDVTSKLDDILKNADVASFDHIEIKLYVDGILASIKGLDVLVDDTSKIKAIMMENDKVIDINSKYYEFKCLNDLLTINHNGTEIFTGTIKEASDDKFDMDYTATISSSKYTGNLLIETNTEDSNVSGKVSFSLITSDNTTYAFKLDYSLKNNITISEIDESNVVDMKDVTESEYTSIYNKLVANFKGTIFEKLAETLWSSTKTSITTNTNCSNAVCIQCSGDTCDCIYLDDNNVSQNITCPNTSSTDEIVG